MIDAVVTGASGFIGRRLTSRLRADGLNVFALERTSDIRDEATWRDVPAAPVLYHLAGRSYVPDSWSDTPAFMATNVVGTQHALNWCKRHGARMVFASAYVYGVPARIPISETDAVNPNNPYALSKHLAERLCEFSANHEGVSVTALRIFNVYGAGQRQEFLIPTLISQVRNNDTITVMDLTPQRDFVYVEDVVEAFVQARNTPNGYNCINIGSGTSLSVAQVIDVIQDVCGTNLPVASSCTARRNEIVDVRADIERAHELIGWRPKWTLSAGIKTIITEL